MLINTIINRQATLKIARALDELNQQVVFVGGAMVSLYIDDPAAEDIRPTKDIDLTFQITSAGKLEELRQALTNKGFNEQADSKLICRFSYEDLLIDVMSTREVGWAPSNRWFEPGFQRAITIGLEDIEIRVLPLSFFLASKMDAFFNRGIQDLYASHDLEDIVYILNYSTDLVRKIQNTDHDEVRNYLVDGIRQMLDDEGIMNALPGHLYFDGVDERMEIILDKMKVIAHGIH